MIKNYKAINKEDLWQGRTDSQSDFKSFRWHQWVQSLDLNQLAEAPKKGQKSFALLGYPCEKGIIQNLGRPGAGQGPKEIRKRMASLPWNFPEDVFLYDAGDIDDQDVSLEESQLALGQAVNKLLDLDVFPILMGGGHDIAYGHYLGIREYLNKQNKPSKLGIINFDAHFDIRPFDKGTSSGTMFNQIGQAAKDQGVNYSYLCLGILPQGNTARLFEIAKDLGAEYILADDLRQESSAINEKISNFLAENDYIYLTVCSDVFSAAHAPGVSAPQALGLNPQDFLGYLDPIIESDKLISFDIAEVSPSLDINNMTTSLAANLIYTLVSKLIYR